MVIAYIINVYMKTNKTPMLYDEMQENTLAKSFTVADKNILSALKVQEKTIVATNKNIQDILGQDGKEEENKHAETLQELEILFRVKESYETQISRYRSLGWVVEQDGKEGIIGVDKNFYVLPTLDQVLEALAEQIELLTYKHSQGFKRFMLVPFGMSYKEMYYKLQREYKRYAEDPKLGLYRMDSTRVKLTEIDDYPSLSIDNSNPLSNDEDLIYYPETLYDSSQHQGKKKAELLASSKFPGFELHLFPENSLLSAGKGEIIGDRPVFEREGHLGDYLDQLKGRVGKKDPKVQPVLDAEGNNVYRGEVGLTADLWASWAFEELYSRNQVLHYYEKDGDLSAALIGNLRVIYWTREKQTPISYFFALDDSVRLDDIDSYKRCYGCEVLSSVKVC